MQSVEEIYQQYIKPLPNREKLRLIAMIANDLAKLENDKLEQDNEEVQESDAKN